MKKAKELVPAIPLTLVKKIYLRAERYKARLERARNTNILVIDPKQGKCPLCAYKGGLLLRRCSTHTNLEPFLSTIRTALETQAKDAEALRASLQHVRASDEAKAVRLRELEQMNEALKVVVRTASVVITQNHAPSFEELRKAFDDSGLKIKQ